MEEFKSNSNKSREDNKREHKKLEKVVTGEVKVRKEPGHKRFLNQMVSEDLENVWQYIVGDVLIPSLKSAISDVVANGIDMLLYGEIRGGSRGSSSRRSSGSRTSYSSYYDKSDREDRRRRANSSERYSCSEIIFDTRIEAEDVLDQIIKAIDEYGMVTVADYYDACGVASKYTDNKYGWDDRNNLDGAKVKRLSVDEYYISLPRPTPID